MATLLELENFLKTLVGQELKTLKQLENFKVLTLEKNQLLIEVSSTKRSRPIPLEEIEKSWRRLLSDGQLTRTDIQAKYSPRNPAYVAAILAKYPSVRSELDPNIELFYKR
jgi:hypothetical protein